MRTPVFSKRSTVAAVFSSLLDGFFRVQDELDAPFSVYTNRLVQIHAFQRDQLLFSIRTDAVELSSFHPIVKRQPGGAALENNNRGRWFRGLLG